MAFQRSRHGAVNVIEGSSPLSEHYVQELRQLLKNVLEEGQPRVVLDMSGVPLCDSEGLELLWSTQKDFQQRGGQLKLAAMNPLCSEILKVTGISKQFEVFPSTVKAIGSFVA